MKELTPMPKVVLPNYEVEVNLYLTLAEIQQIANGVMQFDTWSEREQNKNILTLYHATNLSKEDLEKYPYETLVESGLVDAVTKQIRNYNKIDEALNWCESEKRALWQILKESKPMLEAFREKVKVHGKIKK